MTSREILPLLCFAVHKRSGLASSVLLLGGGAFKEGALAELVKASILLAPSDHGPWEVQQWLIDGHADLAAWILSYLVFQQLVWHIFRPCALCLEFEFEFGLCVCDMA